jgi:hypothetical protein
MSIRSSLAVLLPCALLVVACDAPETPPASSSEPAKPAAAPAAAAPSGARAIGDGARAAMKETLAAESTGKHAWILSQPGNPEVAALVASISSVFKDAGWEVSAETASGISLKPGVMTLVAEEQYPSYIDTALKALDASGLDAKSASGYRGYFEAKKKENPAWPGIPMRADQDFVIVVGPKPAA